MSRPKVKGSFIFIEDEKFFVKGVTYGTFPPNNNNELFPSKGQVDIDFACMAENKINSVRTYTVPPVWLLDIAQKYNMKVMVGIPWEQHISFLDDKKLCMDIAQRVGEAIEQCSRHPAILCFSLGNEIPSSIVRWHGAPKIQKFLYHLYKIGKKTDQEALFTYVNYPTTEYLQLPFLDIVSFNVYLESEKQLQEYLFRLQNQANERPLLMAEIGLDSKSNGLEKQAEVLGWQITKTFLTGCAGAFIFAWTDEWYRGGLIIDDWDFGLTTLERKAKPALTNVRKTFNQMPFSNNKQWPKISVILCSYNGSATIRDTLEGLKRLSYQNFEVIVVNDGSTDNTRDLVNEYNVKLIDTSNLGLSSARNTGYSAATGSIVAYIDDDAYPDQHWLYYLASAYEISDFVAVGGPNIAPPADGKTAECVANSPGGPCHVLLTDNIAEHIPGCNMSFLKSTLEAIGGFDTQFKTAGDDVDICWKIQKHGWKIGFHPTALVWHHSRNSLSAYWKQQKDYGEAESMLEKKWPEKYNTMGHIRLVGRLYGRGVTVNLSNIGGKIYQGSWGTAAFQSLYQATPTTLLSLPLMPEWYFVIIFLCILSLLSIASPPLLTVVLVFLTISIALPVAQALTSAAAVRYSRYNSRLELILLYVTTTCLHLLQPLARLIGRVKNGLTPWRIKTNSRDKFFLRFLPVSFSIWQEKWEDPTKTLFTLKEILQQHGTSVMPGGSYDDWDLELKGGLFGKTRLKMVTEEHGQGKQLKNFLIKAKPSYAIITITIISSIISIATSLLMNSSIGTSISISFFIVLLFLVARDCSKSFSFFYLALDNMKSKI
jgi:glycosyltransferase involved in cell wall biosynthesis